MGSPGLPRVKTDYDVYSLLQRRDGGPGHGYGPRCFAQSLALRAEKYQGTCVLLLRVRLGMKDVMKLFGGCFLALPRPVHGGDGVGLPKWPRGARWSLVEGALLHWCPARVGVGGRGEDHASRKVGCDDDLLLGAKMAEDIQAVAKALSVFVETYVAEQGFGTAVYILLSIVGQLLCAVFGAS